MAMLTAKQRSFTLDVFKEVPPGRAYLTHYKVKSIAVADAAASRLLKNVKIQNYLQELRSKLESDAIGTVEERLKRLTEIYRANLTDFVDQDGNITIKPSAALAELVIEEHVVDQEASLLRRNKRLKLRDPISAIAEQNRMEKIYDDKPAFYNDNRQINIYVENKEDGDALKWLKDGKLPELNNGD